MFKVECALSVEGKYVDFPLFVVSERGDIVNGYRKVVEYENAEKAQLAYLDFCTALRAFGGAVKYHEKDEEGYEFTVLTFRVLDIRQIQNLIVAMIDIKPYSNVTSWVGHRCKQKNFTH